MPQMMPINWIFYFFLFLFLFILFNMLNYYIFPIQFKNNYKTKNFLFKSFNWKW